MGLPGADGDADLPDIVREGIEWLKPQTWRPPGLHVSGIIHDLCLRMGHYADSGGPTQWTTAMRTRMELGCTFEDTLALRYQERYPDRYVGVGCLECDDIFGTPDLLDVEDYAIEEIKLTWLSSRHEVDSEKFWKYWVQLKAYCWMAKARVGRLHVCNINGDYRFGKDPNAGGPIYRVWEKVFSVQELEQNWEMLKRHGEKHYDELVEG